MIGGSGTKAPNCGCTSQVSRALGNDLRNIATEGSVCIISPSELILMMSIFLYSIQVPKNVIILKIVAVIFTTAVKSVLSIFRQLQIPHNFLYKIHKIIPKILFLICYSIILTYFYMPFTILITSYNHPQKTIKTVNPQNKKTHNHFYESTLIILY